MDFVGAAALQRVQFVAQLGRECDVGSGHCAPGLDTEIRHHRIDAVDAGTGHQPHEELGTHRSSAPFRGNYSAPASVTPCPSMSWALSTETRSR